ncbi:MHS family alpha-ketoglutarate permease-like MFS transporter [Tahibacter aquaticus]|uniref:MHS family alpha-ketoglutarate permease-like MFS transporter n=1 Tax=Tahibacter aquaticus TaxID=520092 RepID=A0A4R6YYI2_9GAMM|nr:MFS transporter [Tahibacter aquaticus]TDR43863.1 MHS family alpha-ketoglutarate permease-like MFS transporter [Tahibacter aquaticus]
MTAAQRLRSIFSGSVGNLVEWYDWYVYTAFALYFAPVFFPAGDQAAQLLNTAAVFAVGFLMRPLGAWLLGEYADRHGRKAALVLSVLMMCGGSLLIALTPGYAQIGVAAPVLLLLARLLQGLSVGGEYGASATYLSEMASREHRGFWSSFQYVTLIMGQLLALAVLILLQRFVLTSEQLHDWGWRIPFAVGALAALVSLYLRRSMLETEAFRQQSGSNRARHRLCELLAHPRALLTVVGLTLGGTLAFYTFSTYMQKYLVISAGMSKDTATAVSAATLFVFMLLQPLVGALSDRIGRRPLLIAFGVLGTFGTVPLFGALGPGVSAVEAFGLILLALTAISGYTAINAVVKAELFPVEIRALGVGLPYALTVSIFGGTAEMLAIWFKTQGMESGYYWYVTACIALSLTVYLCMDDTRRTSRIDRDALQEKA